MMEKRLSRTQFNYLLGVLLHIDKHTLDRIGNGLKKAGMISTGGRGLNAPLITYEDAKNIILGVMGTDNASRAAEAVKALSELVSENGATFGDVIIGILNHSIKVPDGSAITVCRSFPEAEIHWAIGEDANGRAIAETEVFRPKDPQKQPDVRIQIEASIATHTLTSIIDILNRLEK